ncbi:SDR family NAD(P)-dependent oxidoreductase [Xenophilus azovorans]|uniref:SDR family NAD(P)-dependent oxidoreductase n=1 Tax=Xenophilus azovorans TaxID=151755 RepID=UPI00068A90A3|nr:SDR family oxidoreductase [Xenophilus azovorans]
MANALKDKAVIVTGAAGGIGSAVAAYLAREGARLVLADIDGPGVERTAAALRQAGHDAMGQQMDVSVWSDCAALVQRCLDLHGRIDGLAGFAGVVYLGKPWEEDGEDRVRRLIEVNLLGTYYVGVQVLRQMQLQGSGSIVNVSSGTQAGMAAGAAYSASKGGVAALTYAWAIDAAPHGIRVNALSPVATTAMTKVTDEYLRSLGQLQGTRPYVDPAANAPAVAFMLSDAAKDFNGQVLRVHGEQVQLMSHPAVMMPVLSRDSWDVDELARGLRESFPGGLPPLGVTGIEATFKPLTKMNQVPR